MQRLSRSYTVKSVEVYEQTNKGQLLCLRYKKQLVSRQTRKGTFEALARVGPHLGKDVSGLPQISQQAQASPLVIGSRDKQQHRSQKRIRTREVQSRLICDLVSYIGITSIECKPLIYIDVRVRFGQNLQVLDSLVPVENLSQTKSASLP